MASSVSALASLITLVRIWTLRRTGVLRSLPGRILTILAVVDLATAVVLWLPPDSSMCFVQGILRQFLLLSSWLWALSLSFHQFLTSVKAEAFPEKFWFLYHVVSWGVPLLSISFLLFSGSMQNLGPWCWIAPEYKWRKLLLFYMPWISVTSIVALLQQSITSNLKRGLEKSWVFGSVRSSVINAQKKRNLAANLLIVNHLPCFVEFLYASAIGRSSIPVVISFAAFFAALQGLSNSFLFAVSKVIQRYITFGQKNIVPLPSSKSLAFISGSEEKYENDWDSVIPDSEIESSDHLPSPRKVEANGSSDFSSFQSFKVFVGSWNLAGKRIENEDAAIWLSKDGVFAAEKYSLVAIGLQECTQPDWVQVFHSTLGESTYSVLGTSMLSGIRLVVFCRYGFDVNSSVESGTEATGFGYVIGNKGASALSFSACGVSLCFITAHLAAHRGSKKFTERNKNVYQILSRLLSSSDETLREIDLSSRFDFIFFFGDLNYRMKATVEKQKILDIVDSSNWRSMLDFDELSSARKQQIVFSSFNEEPINFRPTYKLIKGTSTYELSRLPAWCDRIIYRVRPSLVFEAFNYRSYENVLVSDHFPVSASFAIQKRLDDDSHQSPSKKFEIVFDELKCTDLISSDGLPPEQVYATFSSEFLSKEYTLHSGIAQASDSGYSWTNSDSTSSSIPVLHTERIALHELRAHRVWIILKDFQLIGYEDLLGHACIELFDKLEGGCRFKVPVTHSSKVSGFLSGKMTVRQVST